MTSARALRPQDKELAVAGVARAAVGECTPAPAGSVVEECFVQETGLRNGAHGADKFGFKALTRRSLESHRAARSTSMPIAASEGHDRRRAARSAPRPACIPAAAPRTSSPSATRSPRRPSGGKERQAHAKQFQLLYEDFIAHASGKKLFAQDLYGGADPKYRIKARVFTELAWHSLFIRAAADPARARRARGLRARPHHRRPAVLQGRSQAPRRAHRDHHRASTSRKRIILIGSSSYAGEMKKSVFTDAQLLPAGARA